MAKTRTRADVKLLKTLGHPIRLQILHLLRPGEECVCHLTAALHQRQAYVSQQLMFLRQAGLLADRKDGLRVYYQVRDPRVFEVLDDLEKMSGQEMKDAKLPVVLPNCPCPKCELKGKSKH